MFIDKPRAKHRCGERGAQLRRRLARAAIGHQLDAAQQASAPHVADALVAILQLSQPGREPVAGHPGPLDQALAGDHLEHGQPDGGRQRVAHVRRVEEEAPLVGLGLDRLRGQRGRQRKAGAERLRQGEEVRDDAVTLEGEHRAGAAEPRLGFVDHEQHAPLVASLGQRCEVAGVAGR